MRDEYTIIDDFQAGAMRVLVLDADYEYGGFNKAVIDGQGYSFTLNSIKNWVAIKNFGIFKGKKVKFIRI